MINYTELFKDIVDTHIRRDGMSEVMKRLEGNDFFIAPASTKYHDSERGGLVKHSVKVFQNLCDLVGDTYSMETIAIVSLFHDLCKMQYYEESTRNVKSPDGTWTTVPYYTVNDTIPIGHGEKSIILLLLAGVALTADEIYAIRWHMGGYEPKESYSAMSEAYKNCPLAVYLHMADLKATYID